MNKRMDQIVNEVLSLDVGERADLARTLLASLDDLPENELDRLWGIEAERRYEDYLAGREEAIDADEVFARIRARRK
ncbi:MAG TPA: addiction module protein [Thermoanaerobaculia bacterium]|nr:addiction module protein [Thermoanaerobaculia bacterium]